MTHPSHVTRFSDSSLYDEKCTLCGVTDHLNMDKLNRPCAKAALTVHYPSMAEVPPKLMALVVSTPAGGPVQVVISQTTIPPEMFDDTHHVEAAETNIFDYHCTLCGATDATADRRLAVECPNKALHPSVMDDATFLSTLAASTGITRASKTRLLDIAIKLARGAQT